MDHAQSVSCFIMLAAGSRYETPDTSGIAHFSEHALQGHRDPADRTRHRKRGRRHRRRVQRLHGQGVHRVLRPLCRRAPVDRARRARRHAAALEVRRRRDRAREGRDRRGDEHVLRHAARLHQRRLRLAALRRQPIGWDIIGRKETVRAATRDTFLGYIDRWYKPERMASESPGRSTATSRESSSGFGRHRPDGDRSRRAGEVERNGEPRVKIYTKASDQAHLCLGVPSYPLVHPDRYPLQVLATVLGRACRPASSPRSASGAASLLHLRGQPQLHRCGLALLPGRGRHRADRRSRHDDRRRAPARSRTRPCRRTSSTRRRTSRRAASSSRRRPRTA